MYVSLSFIFNSIYKFSAQVVDYRVVMPHDCNINFGLYEVNVVNIVIIQAGRSFVLLFRAFFMQVVHQLCSLIVLSTVDSHPAIMVTYRYDL